MTSVPQQSSPQQSPPEQSPPEQSPVQGLMSLLHKWNFGLELPADLDARTADKITSTILALRAHAPPGHPAHAAIAEYLALAPGAQVGLAEAFAAGLLDYVAGISPYIAESIRLYLQHTDYDTVESQPRRMTVRQAINQAYHLGALVMSADTLSHLNDVWDMLHTIHPGTWTREDLEAMVSTMLSLEPALANLVPR